MRARPPARYWTPVSFSLVHMTRALLAVSMVVSDGLTSDFQSVLDYSEFAVLCAYAGAASGAMLFSLARGWLWDARLSCPLHILDWTVFAAMLLLTGGYQTPFFMLAIMVLLSSVRCFGVQRLPQITLLLLAAYLLFGTIGYHIGHVNEDPAEIASASLGFVLVLAVAARLFPPAEFRMEPMDTLYLSNIYAQPEMFRTMLRHVMDYYDADHGLVIWEEEGQRHAVTNTGNSFDGIDQPKPTDHAGHAPFAYASHAGQKLSFLPSGQMRLQTQRDLQLDRTAATFGMEQILVIPIGFADTDALIFVARKRPFTKDDVSTATMIQQRMTEEALYASAAHTASIMARKTERSQLAHDLHDTAIQSITSIQLQASAIKYAFARQEDPAALNARVDAICAVALSELHHLRELQHDMEATDLPAADFQPALARLTDALSRQWGISCILHPFSSAGASSLSIQQKMDIIMIIREAVANAVKHGHADRVEIDLSISPAFINLSLSDNGSGLSNTVKWPRSITTRVVNNGGQVEFQKNNGGCHVLVQMPV